MQSDLFCDEQSPEFVHPPVKAKPRKTVHHNGVDVEVSADDGSPNLNLLDTRIYGLQIPTTICRADVRICHLQDLEAEAWKKRYMPLSCVYTAHDFTRDGKVAILIARGYTLVEIAREFPELMADEALAEPPAAL